MDNNTPSVPIRDDSFPPNSSVSKSAAPDKRVNAPVSRGKIRQESLASRTRSAMFASTAKDVGSYIFWDVAIPAIKQIVSDVVTGGVERALFGDSAPRRGNQSRVSYSSYSSSSRLGYNDAPTTSSRFISSRDRRDFRFESIVYDSRPEALETLERLRDILEKYEVATVADLYELSDISTSYTDQNWGWDDPRQLRDAGLQRVREGYTLILPEPVPLRKR